MITNKNHFFDWLQEQQHSELHLLKDYAKSKRDAWRPVRTFSAAWDLINKDDTKTEDEKKELIGMAVLAFQSFDAAQPKGGMGWASAFGLGVFAFMAMILLILFGAIFEPTLFPSRFEVQEPLLSRLADLETSRGLITFVFTVGVIALALIIVTANVTSNDGEGARFERSKEILTSLIAILGTILGFYFGKGEAEDVPVPTVVVQAGAEDNAPAPEPDPAGEPDPDPAAGPADDAGAAAGNGQRPATGGN